LINTPASNPELQARKRKKNQKPRVEWSAAQSSITITMPQSASKLALTQILHPNYKRKIATNNTQSFVGNGSMESDDQRASRHRLLHAEARSADGKSVSGMQRCGGRERSAAQVPPPAA